MRARLGSREGEKNPTSALTEAAHRVITDTACTTVIVCKHGLMTNTHTGHPGVQQERGRRWRKLKENSADFNGPGQLLMLISAGSQMFWKTLEGRF